MSMRSRVVSTLPVVCQNAFELQPEDGFINKPKHVAVVIFNYIIYKPYTHFIKSHGSTVTATHLTGSSVLLLTVPSLPPILPTRLSCCWLYRHCHSSYWLVCPAVGSTVTATHLTGSSVLLLAVRSLPPILPTRLSCC
jgi:hypothetical protein